ncbi:ribonuclease H-like protein [Trametes cingulata]|nr:ribonuclease H-like protein [Trametes cingulata]
MGKSGKPGFYAVARGRVPGVYTSWDECQAQTAGFAGNKHQKFSSLEQAKQYLAANGVPTGSVAGSSTSTATQPAASTSSSSSKPSTSRAASSGSTLGRRTHGSKPYARTQPPASSPEVRSGRNSQWAALSAEVIEDESGWDVVYSDGSCRGNGKLGSVAGIGVWWGENDARNLAERCPGGQTNNRAELIAIVRVLETTPHTKRPLLIKTDSKYSISCFRHWMPKWLQNNFRTASGARRCPRSRSATGQRSWMPSSLRRRLAMTYRQNRKRRVRRCHSRNSRYALGWLVEAPRRLKTSSGVCSGARG